MNHSLEHEGMDNGIEEISPYFGAEVMYLPN